MVSYIPSGAGLQPSAVGRRPWKRFLKAKHEANTTGFFRDKP